MGLAALLLSACGDEEAASDFLDQNEPATEQQQDSGSQGSTSEDSTSGDSTSGDSTSGDSTSGDSTSGGSTSGDSAGGTSDEETAAIDCGTSPCVGPDHPYSSVQAAVDAAPDGGSVGIQDGSYRQCFVIPEHKSLTIKALDGRPHIKSRLCDGDKGVLVNYSKGEVVVDGLELSDAGTDKVIWHHDNTGALILRNVEVHNAGMGILASTNSERLEIHDSEFYDMDEPTQNGHLVYAGQVKDLVIKGSYFHSARNGHMIKAKSVNVDIENNYLLDNYGTTANLINIWGCGTNRVVGNAIVSENRDGAVQAMDVTVRKRYGDVKPCPVNNADITIAYNSFLKKGETLWSSLLLDVYDMDSMTIENNLVTGARLVKDGTTQGVYWYPGDWNGKNQSYAADQYLDDQLHVESAPSAVDSAHEPTEQYRHPMATEPRDNAYNMGAYSISQ
ncbi:right-handed parallel beta-helix repeat-containing protein [Thiohalorhabdus denitrificans]|uniref:right-handed parallel beta-helix repeat-containing protein n=1 Tax=Thiohalorhabdus denitrificans TaxID=381306 RepID=UPI000942D5F1|nr:right-handed parallel beta-helix repeat-containing protein [Thiohalorhabdus denitrificans]